MDSSLYHEFENEYKEAKEKGQIINKKAMMFSYLLRFNERNPVYFPVDVGSAFKQESATEIKFD